MTNSIRLGLHRRLLNLFVPCLLFLCLASQSWGQTHQVLLLWPNGAPGSEGKTEDEILRVDKATGEHVVTGINKPSITCYFPSSEKASGAAIVIAPGGGHRELWMDHEGYNVAQWFADHGVAAFVLKYRLSKATNSTYTVDGNELQDMQRAIRLVRSHADEWKIAPRRIGVMGFSAGGEVAFLSAMHFDNGIANAADPIDRESCQPYFQALIYPGNCKRLEPSTNSPAAFLCCGSNDRADISEGLAEAYLKFKHVKIPVELHIFGGVGHGFGLRTTNTGGVAKWPERVYESLETSGFLKNP